MRKEGDLPSSVTERAVMIGNEWKQLSMREKRRYGYVDLVAVNYPLTADDVSQDSKPGNQYMDDSGVTVIEFRNNREYVVVKRDAEDYVCDETDFRRCVFEFEPSDFIGVRFVKVK